MSRRLVLLVSLTLAGAGLAASEAQEQQMLSRESLQQLKQTILASGHRCTFSNMYNHNPCLRAGGLDLYLIPDPGPDGHPQWNLNSDPAKGDFHQLLVVPLDSERRSAQVSFFDDNDLQFEPPDDPAAPALLTEALRAVLGGGPLGRPTGLP